MEVWSLCYTKDCIHHDVLVNYLFNYFMSQGLEVYVRVPLSIPPISQVKIHIGERGELIEESKIKHTLEADLVTISSDGFTRGYEVKTDFESVVKAISSDQLIGYVNSGYFDEVYLVVPANICNRVLSSYGEHLSSNGIGLICIDAASLSMNTVIKPRQLSKRKSLNAIINHDWIKHMVMSYLLSRGYCVYPEISIPKPLNSLPRIMPLQGNPQKYLNRIDLIAMRSNCAPCDIACGLCEGDVIGVEVKYNVSKLSSNDIRKLREYIGSGVISKMYLAIDNSSNVHRILGQVRNLADVLVIDPRSRSITLRFNNAISIKPRFCAFVFEPPSASKLTILSYCDLCRYKYEVPAPPASYNLNAVKDYIINVVSRTCSRNNECLRRGSKKIIYVKRTRSSHVIYVI